MQATEEFRRDLRQLTVQITNTNRHSSEKNTLGDVLQQMSKEGKLLLGRDDNFDDVPHLCEETRLYLNALQTEKLYKCRKCYHKNDADRCWFHKKYIFDKDRNEQRDEYVKFLYSEMGIVSFVELYYSFLQLDMWKYVAKEVLKDLCGYENIKSLLNSYNHNADDDVDIALCESMDYDEDTTAQSPKTNSSAQSPPPPPPPLPPLC
ncbi:hypothetical protein [Perigonia lusca single nucleopolyhedrovirus]|uniref:Uncharacterized protein n=1 Tax=Perigonia lusca single nucleopolyhedrovirus TaxID=1675865 RepID=A0A0M3WNV5_9ABAC|nr:hypothetical protein [Perigonia lusca single nucleopolyhedrovirus]AKN80565.1 hypothetical protein [Perigonia lusca single nucleopolyhedrovirus]